MVCLHHTLYLEKKLCYGIYGYHIFGVNLVIRLVLDALRCFGVALIQINISCSALKTHRVGPISVDVFAISE